MPTDKTLWANQIVGYDEVSPDDLLANPNNFRLHPKHQQDILKGALDEIGWIQDVIVNRVTGHVIDGHLRVTLAMRHNQPTVPVKYVDLTPEQEALALATFDPISALAGQDQTILAALLADINAEDPHLVQFIAGVRDDIAATLHMLDADDERAAIKGRRPGVRNIGIDAILCMNELGDITIPLAVNVGFKIGAPSQSRSLVEANRIRWEWRAQQLTFIDNEFALYDHAQHLDAVQRFKPKYATVRDVMTRSQCDAAGIAYYDFDQIMRWAEELAAFAENVIVIPKYDCLDEIPSQYMLGYSVPTSYGGTPMPLERFRGWRVHLLGGSWKRQLEYLALLGDDIVSLDGNMMTKVAVYGQYVQQDGTMANLANLLPDRVSNPRMMCIALSLGNMGKALYDLTGDERFAGDALADGEVTEDDLDRDEQRTGDA